jgi:hypothetical protein
MVIRDYCAGGLFLQCEGDIRPAALTDPLPESLTIRFHDPSTEQTCQFDGAPVRTTQDGIAVAFEVPRLDLVAVLATVALAQSKSSRASSAAVISRDQAEHVVASCRREISHEANRLIPPYISTLITYLDDLAGLSRSQAVADAFQAASRTLGEQQSDWEFALIQAIQRCPDKLLGWAPSGGSHNGDGKTSELPEPASVEELDVIRNAESQLAEPLEQLSQRLGRILGSPIDKQSNPLGPATLTECLRVTLPPTEPQAAITRVIYRRFQRYVLSQLGPFYERLDRALSDPASLLDTKHWDPSGDRNTAEGPQSPGQAGSEP